MTAAADTAAAGTTATLLRPHAEQVYARELAALIAADDHARPPSWLMSPQAVVTYLLGDRVAAVCQGQMLSG